MTLNGVMARSLRFFTEFGSFRGALRKRGWTYTKLSATEINVAQKHLVFSDISLTVIWYTRYTSSLCAGRLNYWAATCVPKLTRSKILRAFGVQSTATYFLWVCLFTSTCQSSACTMVWWIVELQLATSVPWKWPRTVRTASAIVW